MDERAKIQEKRKELLGQLEALQAQEESIKRQMRRKDVFSKNAVDWFIELEERRLAGEELTAEERANLKTLRMNAIERLQITSYNDAFRRACDWREWDKRKKG